MSDPNDIRIIPFNPLAAGEDLWKAYLAHMDAVALEADPGEPPVPGPRRRAMVLAAEKLDYTNKHIYLALSGGEAAGCAFVSAENAKSPSYAENKHIGNLKLSVLPKYRRQGLGSTLLRHLAAEMAAKEPLLTEFVTALVLDAGRAFLERAGGTVSLVHAENRLYLAGFDWTLAEAWAADGARRNPATAVLAVESIPGEDLERFCDTYTETINQQPMGDLTLKMRVTPEQMRQHEALNSETGTACMTIYTREADGSVSGLTEAAYVKEVGHKVYQMLTGVRADCRGRGLGKLLKALMLLEIRRRYPGVKYISTGNAASNAPMMGINNKLGFRKHLQVLICKLKIGPGLRQALP